MEPRTERPQILLYTARLATTGGGQHALARLAAGLKERGYPVHVFTEPPFDADHRYVRWLRQAGLDVDLLPEHDPGPLARAAGAALQWMGMVPWALVRGRALRASRESLAEIFRTLHTRCRYRRILRAFTRAADPRRAILHTWGPSALTPELLAWARERQVPVLYHEMGEADPAYVKTWRLHRTVETVSAAACVVCCSPTIERNIRDVYGYEGPVHSIPFPVEDPPSEVPSRRPGGPVVFGAIGRLVPHKRHSELIRAVKTLREQGLDVELLIAGDGPIRAELEGLVASLGLGSAVRFTGEFESLAAVMAAFDVFALTSASESQCMPITESMAYGKAVIASRFGGMPDFVAEGETGLLVELGDQEGLVAAMRRLAADGELRHRMGRNGRARYLDRYTEGQLFARYERIYSTLRP